MKINDPVHVVESRYGRLGYFDRKGEPKYVGKQDDFAFALNELYMLQDINEGIRFNFQPESDKEQTELHRCYDGGRQNQSLHTKIDRVHYIKVDHPMQDSLSMICLICRD